MGRFFALTLPGSQIQIKNKPKTVAYTKNDWGVWLVILLVVFGILYFLEVNGLSTKGYEIKKLEKKMVELKEAEKRLEIESAALQSIQKIEESVRVLNLVPSKEVNYPGQNGYAYQNQDLN